MMAIGGDATVKILWNHDHEGPASFDSSNQVLLGISAGVLAVIIVLLLVRRKLKRT